MRRGWVLPMVLAAACTGAPDAGPTSSPASTTSQAPATPGPTTPGPSAPVPDPDPTPGPGATTAPDMAPVTGVPFGTPADAPSPAGQVVVTTPDGAVLLVAPDDGTTTTLSDNGLPGLSVQPTAGPGGQMLWTETGDDLPIVAVHDGTTLRRLQHPVAPYLYLPAPDGSRFAALGADPGGAGVAMAIADDLDSDAVSFTTVDAGQPYFITWRPDSTMLAAHVDDTELSLVDVDGTRTTLDVPPGAFQAPDWTEDGDLVVVVDLGVATRLPTGEQPAAPVTLQDVSGVLATVDPATAAVTPVANVTGPTNFTVAGNRVAWSSGVGPGGSTLGPLQVVDLDTGIDEVVSTAPVIAFEWSPDGTRLLFHEAAGDRGFVSHVWDGSDTVDFPAWIPTARLLAEYLPFWSQYTRGITQWAPTGDAFTYAEATDDGAGTIWVQPLDGERRMVADGDMAIWAPAAG